jgi:hypothetical protein
MSTDEAVRAFVAYSDEHDLQLAARLAAWRDGWQACETHLGDQYEAGYAQAQADFKALQHGTIRDLTQHVTTWDGLRQHFARPRPGDYTGGPA